MPLTTEEKQARARSRMIETARQYQVGTYSRKFVAPLFQRTIRAEYAAQPDGGCAAIVDGEFRSVWRDVGWCVCVTCGRRGRWRGASIGGGTIETGHFIAGRSNSILFEEDNVAPQCVICNRHRGGEQQLFRKWMEAVRGIDVIERLERLKTQSVSFTREELVDMRIAYQERLRAAEGRMM